MDSSRCTTALACARRPRRSSRPARSSCPPWISAMPPQRCGEAAAAVAPAKCTALSFPRRLDAIAMYFSAVRSRFPKAHAFPLRLPQITKSIPKSRCGYWQVSYCWTLDGDCVLAARQQAAGASRRPPRSTPNRWRRQRHTGVPAARAAGQRRRDLHSPLPVQQATRQPTRTRATASATSQR